VPDGLKQAKGAGMAGGIQKVGKAGLEMTLDFPDAKMREDFEVAFRGWLKQYQQTAATHLLVGALASKDIVGEGKGNASGEGEEDTSAYLFRYTNMKTGEEFYLDFFGSSGGGGSYGY
jgi:hypothetical protein